MLRRVRMHGTGRVIGLGAALLMSVGLTGPAAGTAGAAPVQEDPPPGPTITVTPASGVEVGDTVTVAGTGLVPGSRYMLSACAEGVLTDPAWPVDEYCGLGAAFVDSDAQGAIATELVVGSPGWEAIHAYTLADGPPAVAALSVTGPPGPEVVGTLVDDTLDPGQTAHAGGYAWPVALSPQLKVLACDTVPAPATDQVAVEAACGPIAAAEPVAASSPVGSFSAVAVVEEGDEALWVGAQDGAALVATALPLTVSPIPPRPTLTVTPSEGLVDGQVVTVEGAGVQKKIPYYNALIQCRGDILEGGITGGEFVSSCSADTMSGITVADDGTFTDDFVVHDEFTISSGPAPETVQCGAAPGDCAVVVFRTGLDEFTLAGHPISFLPDPPELVPLATEVVEGDSGAVTADVPVVLSAPSSSPVTVTYMTADLSVPWAAIEGEDYEETAGTLTFQPGETAKTIPVEVLGDTADEEDEMALVYLHQPTGAEVGGFSGIGGVVIQDDD